MPRPRGLNSLLEMTFRTGYPLFSSVLHYRGAAVRNGLADFLPEFGSGPRCVFACFILFALNVMGGGDAKLLTASAVWFGFNSSLTVFLIAVAFIGGILTIGILSLRSHSQEIMASGLPVPDSLLVAKKVPYGIAIAVGGLMAYPESPIVQAAMRAILL